MFIRINKKFKIYKNRHKSFIYQNTNTRKRKEEGKGRNIKFTKFHPQSSARYVKPEMEHRERSNFFFRLGYP